VDARDKLVLGPRASARTRVRGHDEPLARTISSIPVAEVPRG
jgi:hypothetical protein